MAKSHLVKGRYFVSVQAGVKKLTDFQEITPVGHPPKPAKTGELRV